MAPAFATSNLDVVLAGEESTKQDPGPITLTPDPVTNTYGTFSGSAAADPYHATIQANAALDSPTEASRPSGVEASATSDIGQSSIHITGQLGQTSAYLSFSSLLNGSQTNVNGQPDWSTSVELTSYEPGHVDYYQRLFLFIEFTPTFPGLISFSVQSASGLINDPYNVATITGNTPDDYAAKAQGRLVIFAGGALDIDFSTGARSSPFLDGTRSATTTYGFGSLALLLQPGYQLDTADNFMVDAISTVPESGTALLMLVGISAVGMRIREGQKR
jgi:hypothetical protein